jgi:hypothetical protein
MTNGDNAGVLLGVASGTVMGPSRHLTGAFTVLWMGMPATRLTSVSLQNSTNCPGVRTVPSQPLVLLLAPYLRRAAPPRASQKPWPTTSSASRAIRPPTAS